MAELLKEYEPVIESIALSPSDGGCFEVRVNDQLVFSKLKIFRFPEPGEVIRLIRKMFPEE